jgi:hypothetical protein
MKTYRIAPVLLAALIHAAPFASRSLTGLALLPSTATTVLRWIVGTLAVAGTYHAVSAGSAVLISASTINATVGTRLSYQVKISDGTSRLPESWEVAGEVYPTARGSITNGLPPGLALSLSTAIISGIPTQGGTFTVDIVAHEHPNFGGAQLAFTLTFKIAGGASPPTITTQPSGGTVTEGGSFTFNVVASGSGALAYQWKHDGANVVGATGASLTLNPVQLSDAGDYQVAVSNSGGTTTSAAATLSVSSAATPPEIATPPQSVNLHVGEGLTLSVVAAGTPPLGYQWQRNGQDLADQTNPTLTLTTTTADNAGDYTVVVTNGQGSTTSPAATVTLVPLALTVQTVDAQGATLVVQTIPGRHYIIEASDSFSGAGWTTVMDTTASDTTLTVVDSSTSKGLRFWRCHVTAP